MINFKDATAFFLDYQLEKMEIVQN